MNWQEVCEHPSLQDLPFKIELDENGKIILSPAKVYHSFFQGEIAFLLHSLLKDGKTLTECAIKTSKGTKVADVAWASMDVWAIIKTQTEASIAPEICVEIISDSNTQQEMVEKRQLYFEAGAKEVWMCDEQGDMSFYNTQDQLIHSELVSGFPLKIDV
ncbi:MAG: Uma2 family endonuclease [Methylovulum sp.]|uniref:Uma2 family endonuclease n=1 Tax=Methylovulum sp. TaxID=1916980 RepID=UPI0026125B3D|nr:Uma2 family endonuclease [Methylovulum sp.]MDD2725434.1 Uma2 family endonuclease [Methylovulum sp.]MDD5124471.1 Uma2 family endonuclease [Methylovulum sp.]